MEYVGYKAKESHFPTFQDFHFINDLMHGKLSPLIEEKKSSLKNLRHRKKVFDFSRRFLFDIFLEFLRDFF